VRVGRRLIAIEVKSGRAQSVLAGMQAFNVALKPDWLLLVGADGIALDDFLRMPVESWAA
jgi:hypothetical protein